MKIYDITRPLLSAPVYPGDKSPKITQIRSIEAGDNCCVSELEMNVHNGTHMDAPRHFVRGGAAIDKIPLETTVGRCTVVTLGGTVTPDDIYKIPDFKRILFRGNSFLTPESAQALAERGTVLIGVERQSVAPESDPVTLHRAVLSKGIVILEGLDLSGVEDGEYFLSAAPLNLEGCDGSPCRAYLISGFCE